ncbi:N-acetylmuramoyl-L-alanine amidase LytC precursor [Sedimentisphaera cyanobacteriorum]|uniref:N-acetylmuramoyl-L-alanine amidase n=1 Tax=Sedimentisphaera cyanobacteriorum TaxID=1940790 RepID=A0A1Q2HQR8_9BACT|nr:N-acetylmuramoyl-L-alanine amidase [Sedimentisphaera cyanobacteriorum]AQQ09797.1 N-acetylmuramoyl-L-alanine amidase LytC precursor [Sedimentisphaera cyanobacteriorum]
MAKKRILSGLAVLLTGAMLAGCSAPSVQAPVVVGKDSRLERIENRTPDYTYQQPQRQQRTGSVKGKTFIIDAGHGGKDPGALGKALTRFDEKQINLDTAKKTAYYLKQKGARVIMSRDDDTFIELNARAALAERYSADALISIHADWCGTPSVSGASFFIARSAVGQSKRLASALEKEFRDRGLPVRGVRRADFRVLVKHSKPSTLIELGFMSNPAEAKRLSSSSYRTKLAKAIAAGIERAY